MSQINNGEPFKGDEFDAFMGQGPAPAPASSAHAAPEPEEPAQVPPPGRKRVAKAAASEPAARKKKLILLGAVGAVVLVAGVGLIGAKRGGGSPSGDPSLSPEIAEVIAAADKIGSQPPTPSPDYGIPTDETVLAVPTLEADRTAESEPAPTSETIAAPGEAPQPATQALAAAPASPPAQAAAAPAPAPAPAQASTPVADTGEFTRRIEALEGDLARARRGLKERDGRISRLEREARKGDYTLVAVLSDGAVVRDSSGREQVIAVGRKVGQ